MAKLAVSGSLFILMLSAGLTLAEPQRPGRGPGPASDPEHQADMELFHYLFDHRGSIQRSVERLPEGVETLTESDNPEVARVIKKHVKSMYRRIEEGRPIHLRDPLFREIFRNADKIHMTLEETEKGLRVRETSEDPWVARLIQEHSAVIDAFLSNGRSEAHKDHPLPSAASPAPK